MPEPQPLLPSPEPESPSRRPLVKTLVLWLVLTGSFFACYHVLKTTPAERASGPACVPNLGAPYLVSIALLGGLALLWWQFRGSSRFNERMAPGLAALQLGNLEDAARVFGTEARRYRGQLTLEPIALWNLATARTLQGEFGDAVEALVRVERWSGLSFQSHVRALAAISLVEVLALRGRTGEARRWLEEARRRFARAGSAWDGERWLLVSSEALLLVREGRGAEARTHQDRNWTLLEGAMSYTRLRRQWVLRAFAAAPPSGPRDDGEIDRCLATLRPARRGEFRSLCLEWPELAAFLSAHGFADSTTA